MENSILTSVKKNLGIDASYTVFDLDIITLINSAFSTLNQIGIGPENGYTIEDATAMWTSFIGTNALLNSVKTYVHLKVRIVFDPPSTSYLVDAYRKQIEEFEWRLNTVREGTDWESPEPVLVLEGSILDGGSP
jgi:hypothetical protein